MEPNLRNEYIRGHVEYEAPHWRRTDADRLNADFETHTTVDSEGVVRWKSNGNFPPTAVIEFWHFLGKPFDYEKTLQVRKVEENKFLDDCFKQQVNRKITDEERFEMTSAFGKGATVVNILTGQKTQL